MANSTLTTTTAIVTWTKPACAVNFTLRISQHGLNSWTSYSVGNVATYTFTGLTAGLSYDWEIETDCNSSNSITSTWTSITTFTLPSPRVGEIGEMMPFNVYPNPANLQVIVSFSTMNEGAYNIRLTDMFGKTVKTDSDNASSGDNLHAMNLDGIAKGVYIIELEKSGQISKTKLVVQ